jgi:hypothetical protein
MGSDLNDVLLCERTGSSECETNLQYPRVDGNTAAGP